LQLPSTIHTLILLVVVIKFFPILYGEDWLISGFAHSVDVIPILATAAIQCTILYSLCTSAAELGLMCI